MSFLKPPWNFWLFSFISSTGCRISPNLADDMAAAAPRFVTILCKYVCCFSFPFAFSYLNYSYFWTASLSADMILKFPLVYTTFMCLLPSVSFHINVFTWLFNKESAKTYPLTICANEICSLLSFSIIASPHQRNFCMQSLLVQRLHQSRWSTRTLNGSMSGACAMVAHKNTHNTTNLVGWDRHFVL